MANVGQVATGVVGAGVGFLVAGPTGALYGFSLGLSLGGVLFPPEAEVEKPEPAGLQVQTSQYGVTVPVLFGTRVLTGNLLWYGNFQTIEHTEEVEAGKGGSTQTTTNYTYTVSMAVGICLGPAKVLRCWQNNQEVPLSKMRIYDGTQTAADPHLAQFVSRAPVWKNLCYVVFEDYDLGASAYIPNFRFEVSTSYVDVNTSIGACSSHAGSPIAVSTLGGDMYVLEKTGAYAADVKKYTRGRMVSTPSFVGSGLNDMGAYYTSTDDCGAVDSALQYRVQIDTKNGVITGFADDGSGNVKVFSDHDLTLADRTQEVEISGSSYYTGTWTILNVGTGWFSVNASFTAGSEDDGGTWKKKYDTFRWSDSGGTKWNATRVTIGYANSYLKLESSTTQRVYVMFGSATGHTPGDYWDFSTDPTPGSYVATLGSYGDNNGLAVRHSLALYDAGTSVEHYVTGDGQDITVACWNQSGTATIPADWVFGSKTFAVRAPHPHDQWACADENGNVQKGDIRDDVITRAVAADGTYIYVAVNRGRKVADASGYWYSVYWNLTEEEYIYVFSKSGVFVERIYVGDSDSAILDLAADGQAVWALVGTYDSGTSTTTYSVGRWEYAMGAWQAQGGFTLGTEITDRFSVDDLYVYTSSGSWSADPAYVRVYSKADGSLIRTLGTYSYAGGELRPGGIASDENGVIVAFPWDQLADGKYRIQLYAFEETSGFDVVPPAVTEEILTNELFGLGLGNAYLDTAVFGSTKAYCVANDMFVSMLFSRQMSVLDALQYIISHHDGYITYYDGKIAHRQLKREVSRGLLSTAANDFVEKKGSWPIRVSQKGARARSNKIVVEYTKRDRDYVKGTAVADDMVDMDTYGVRNSTVKLDGLTTYARASRMANLLLQKQLLNPKSLAFRLGPKSIDMKPGEVWDVTDANLELSAEQVRITAIAEGSDYVLDVTALEDKAYEHISYGADTTVPPELPSASQAAGYVQRPLAIELPALYSGDDCLVAITYSRSEEPSWAGSSLYLAYSEGGSYVKKASQPRAGITGSVVGVGFSNADAYIDVQLDSDDVLTSAVDFDDLITVQTKNLVCVRTAAAGDVFLRFQNADLVGTRTWRLYGLLYDTPGVPRWNTYGAVAAGDEVGFYQNAPYIRTIADADKGKTLWWKLPSLNPRGEEQSLAVVQPISEFIDAYDDKPLPPGALKVNGVWIDDSGAITIAAGDVTVEWTSRNRKNTGAYVYDRTDAIQDDPDLKEFQLEFWNGSTLRRQVNQTAKAYTYTAAQQSADGAVSPLTVKVKQVSTMRESDYATVTVTTV